MNIENKKCKFNLGIEMEASGSRTNKPYNLHLYFFSHCISISPVRYYIPLRFSIGFRSVKTNAYINLGFFSWNFVAEYKSNELIRTLSSIMVGACLSRFCISVVNIGKVDNKKYYLFPIRGGKLWL